MMCSITQKEDDICECRHSKRTIVLLLGTIKVNVGIKIIKCKPQNYKLKTKQQNYFMFPTSKMMSVLPSLPQCSRQKGRQTERNYISQKSWPILGFHNEQLEEHRTSVTGHKQKVLQIQAWNQGFSPQNHSLGLKGPLEVIWSRTLIKAEQLQS